MSNWDEDSPRLRQNLQHVLQQIAQGAESRTTPITEWARRWQFLIMRGLDVPNVRHVGKFRGESGLENLQVTVGGNHGAPPARVAEELKRFEATLQTLVAELDEVLPIGHELHADQLAALLDLCAWAHAEWIRIHPFANGNGRTARLWANYLAMRYGLPPFVRLRPRPNTDYADAGERAMRGQWKPTADAFRRLLQDFLDEF